VHYSHHPSISTVDTFASSRAYKNRDTVTISRSAMGDAYDSKLAMFFEEHLHEDEEIRYIEDGAGYFDVRGKNEEWVRIWLEKGDLIVLPAGIWHRFTVDEAGFTRAVRLFRDEVSEFARDGRRGLRRWSEG
jgi:1,2-dihydroxy-3-keto-5-methylthiopentene dioxygenase